MATTQQDYFYILEKETCQFMKELDFTPNIHESLYFAERDDAYGYINANITKSFIDDFIVLSRKEIDIYKILEG